MQQNHRNPAVFLRFSQGRGIVLQKKISKNHGKFLDKSMNPKKSQKYSNWCLR